MIIFDEKTRKLETSTGYLKRITEEFCVFISPIYLAKSDSKDNYAEIGDGEYSLIKRLEAEKIQKDFEEQQKRIQEEIAKSNPEKTEE